MTPAGDPDTSRVRFNHDAVLIPDFTVTPLVGPWLLRHAIARPLETTSRRLDRVAEAGS